MKRTILEKYNLVLEGKYSQEQFRKDCLYELPQYITPVNSFSDVIKILKNKNIIIENKIGSDILGWFKRYYPNYRINIQSFGDKKIILNFENGKELPVQLYQELEDQYDIYENDESDELTGYHKYSYTIEPKEVVSNRFDYDKTAGEPLYNPIVHPTPLGGYLMEGKKKEKTLTPDEVNYYEYHKGLEYEIDEKGRKLGKAEEIVLKNLSKDPMYYTRLFAGEKIVKNRNDQYEDISKSKSPKDLKDDKNAIDKVKGSKTVKDNVKDTLGKKESPKSSPKLKQQTMTPQKQKGVKVMEVPKTKEKILRESIKQLIRECMCELDIEETVHIPAPDKEMFDEPDNFSPLAQKVKDYLDSIAPNEDFFVNRYGDVDNVNNGAVLLTYGYWEEMPNDILSQLEQEFSVEYHDDLGHRVYYMVNEKY